MLESPIDHSAPAQLAATPSPRARARPVRGPQRRERVACAWLAAGMLVVLAIAACGAARVESTRHAAASGLVRYEITETKTPVLGDAAPGEIERALARVAAAAGLALRGDGRLALLAQQFRDEPSPDPEELAASARELGLVDAELALHEVSAPTREGLPDALASALSGPLRAQAPTHFGAFVDEGGLAVTLVVGRRPLAFESLPRQLPRGATLDVRGLLQATYSNPKLVVSGPDASLALPAGPGPAFELRVPTHAAGAYRLELQARAGERVRSLALLVVYVGVAPPHAQASSLQGVATISPGELRRALYARTARLRTEHALPMLTSDARLELRAQHHSQRLAAAAEQGGDAHADESTNDDLVSVARGKNADALWTLLMADGVLRAKLLGTEAALVGIGIARAHDGYLVSYAWSRPPAVAVDLELSPASVLAALNQHRGVRGAPALKPDPELTRVAQRAVRELTEPPERSEREVIERANAELGRFRLSYRRVAAVAARVHEPLEAAALEPALDADACAAGIAVAERESPGSEGNFAVVIALGWPRQE